MLVWDSSAHVVGQLERVLYRQLAAFEERRQWLVGDADDAGGSYSITRRQLRTAPLVNTPYLATPANGKSSKSGSRPPQSRGWGGLLGPFGTQPASHRPSWLGPCLVWCLARPSRHLSAAEGETETMHQIKPEIGLPFVKSTSVKTGVSSY